MAEEFAPFRTTGVEGYVDMRYLSDEFGSGSDAGHSRQVQGNFRTDVFLMTHNYIYHPGFMTLDIGGGPILQQSSYANDESSTTTRGTLYNFSTRATFFKDKPMRGSVFFDHLNPTLTVAPGQVMTQESTRHGFDASISSALSPIPLAVAYTSTQTAGRGAERTLDDRINQFNVNASRSYGALGSTQFQYQASHQESLSGNVNLPIQASSADSQGMNLDTRLQFGSERQHDFTHLLSINTRKYALGTGSLPDQRDLSVLFDLRSRHDKTFNTYAMMRENQSSQGELLSTTRSLGGGLAWLPTPDVDGSLGLRSEENRTQQFTVQTRGLDAAFRHQREVGIGSLQISYGMHYDQRSQVVSAPEASVIGEMQTLTGTTPLTLSRPRVSAGSVVVINATQTQTFIENVDYLLTVVGAETRIQRLVAGAILDGEQVLINYRYDTGGTYATTQLDQTLNVNWGLSRYLNVYVLKFDSAPKVTSGTPSFPPNVVHSNIVGVRADVPLKLGVGITVGGNIEREERRETISPYRREAENVYLQTDEPVFGLGNFRFSARHTRMTYDTAAPSVNLSGYDLRYWTRPWFGVDISAAHTYEQDSGGLLPRQRTDDSINAQWKERKLTLTATLLRSHETQGDFERKRFMFQVIARRDF